MTAALVFVLGILIGGFVGVVAMGLVSGPRQAGAECRTCALRADGEAREWDGRERRDGTDE